MFGIQKQVLNRLNEFVGEKTNVYTSKSSQESFWDSIDKDLPIEQSLELHRLQVQYPSQPKNFDTQFLSPSLEDFFFAFCDKNDKPAPVFAKASITTEHEDLTIEDSDLVSYLEGCAQWKLIDEKWVCCKQEFTFDELKNICMAYIKDECTWKCCSVLEKTYQDAEDFINSRETDEDFSNVKSRMNELRYITNTDLKNEVEKVTGKKSGITLSPLKVSRTVTDSLRKMMHSFYTNGNEEEEEEECHKEVEVSQWHKDRLAPLLEIANTPVSEKKRFEVNSALLASREEVIDPILEQGSVAEVLFSTEEGNAAPIPYSSSKAVIEKRRNKSFTKDVIRRFVAQTLLEHEFTSCTSAGLEILTDVIENELNSICLNSSIKYHPENGSTTTPKSCVLQTICDKMYGIKQ